MKSSKHIEAAQQAPFSPSQCKPRLLPCPFCGGEASPEGVTNFSDTHEAWWADGTRIVTSYFCNCTQCGCTNNGLLGHQTQEKAIDHWNSRAHDQTLTNIREMVSRFLIAHRDTNRTWIEAFVECGAITADFNYHPLYPFIKPVLEGQHPGESSSLIRDPQTPEQFINNVRFQLANVDGYTQMARDRNEDLNAARIKSKCLVEASAALLAKLEAECRKDDVP